MRKIILLGLFLCSPLAATWASDYLFLNDRYLTLTQDMVAQADKLAPATFETGSKADATYRQTSAALRTQISEIRRAKLFKKLKEDKVAQVKDQAFAANLNTFKFGLGEMAKKTGKTLPELFPSYENWVKTEVAVVQMGLDQRLQAFTTRFGPDSEQVNFIELFTGEALFRGDEAAPSPWEPIFRLSAVQMTTSGPGIVSSFETGMNFYFTKSEPPAPLSWIGISNHIGLAASLQYLNDPRLMRFEGRPSFGLMVHLDRKEVGASWDPDRKTVRMTLGYAFQFVPFLL